MKKLAIAAALLSVVVGSVVLAQTQVADVYEPLRASHYSRVCVYPRLSPSGSITSYDVERTALVPSVVTTLRSDGGVRFRAEPLKFTLTAPNNPATCFKS